MLEQSSIAEQTVTSEGEEGVIHEGSKTTVEPSAMLLVTLLNDEQRARAEKIIGYRFVRPVDESQSMLYVSMRSDFIQTLEEHGVLFAESKK